MTQPASALSLDDELDEPPFPVSVVADALRQFGKAARAQQLYMANNPMHLRAMDAVRDSFRALWRESEALVLQISDSEFCWLGRAVVEEPGRTSDSLPWLFYKDGVRELTMLPGFEDEELGILLQLIQRTRLASSDDDDILSLLWGQEFSCLQYRYVELGGEAAATLTGATAEPGSRIESPQSVESGGAEVLTSSAVARMDDYDSTLYFLDDGEIDYLQREIRADFSSDLRSQVIASLLDTYEQETDPTVREEIAGVLDQLLLVTLSVTHFRAAAYLIREATITAGRALDILESENQRLLALADRLSEPETLEELLTALEHTALRPPQPDLHELFAQLRPKALETVLGWIGRSRNAELRALLESAGSKMASAHSAELVRLIGSDDDVVAFEAIRRAGSTKAAAAVPSLAGTLAHGPPNMRLASVTALSQIASPGAMQALERALGDEDSDVRIAAVRVLAAGGYGVAVARIEAHLRSRELKEGSLAEKMAFFESYGELCGDAGVEFLEAMVGGRRLLGKREPSEVRACAVVALGRIGTSRANQVLQRLGGDTDIIVRNAVSRVLRGG
ncbi:MAG TPA: HEAT repeat domain-containing protein [Gemmatimonadaceae bacterium]